MKSPLRRIVANFATALTSVSITLLGLEFGIRLFSPQDLGYFDSRSFRRNVSTSPHFVENIPNGKANFLGVPVVINSLGLRGGEIRTPRPPNTVRILTVGDSITFGYGIPLEATYSKVLEKLLNQPPSPVAQYEVLNGGTLGGSLGDYFHFLTQKAETLQPQIVLIGLCLNDIFVYSEAGGISEVATERGRELPLLRRLNRFLLRRSQLYTLSYARFKSFLYGSGIVDFNEVQGSNFLALAPPSPHQAQAWESSLGMLSRIMAFCRQHSYRLVVVIFPMQMQMSITDFEFYKKNYHLKLGAGTLSGEPQQRLRDFATTAGLSIVDLLPVYRTYPSQELYVRNKMIPSDPTHPSVKGNQVAADEIFRVLRGMIICGNDCAGRRPKPR